MATQVVVLAEDRRSQQFARRFLLRLGYQAHHIRLAALPSGAGSGSAYVLRNYLVEVSSLRSRPSALLLTHLDADRDAVAQRRNALAEALADAAVTPPAAALLFHWIPKRNIEAWLLHLLDRQSSEDTDLKHDYEHAFGAHGRHIRNAAEQLFVRSRPNAPLSNDCPPSLLQGVAEAARLPRP